MELATKGMAAADHSRELATAVNVHDGKVTNCAVAKSFHLEFVDLWQTG
jgi:alanine dehydrogenase